jgi:hypothetical protein
VSEQARHLLLISALALTATLAFLPVHAAGQSGSRQTASLLFTAQEPGSATGLVLRIDYRDPDHPRAKPPAVRRVVTELAPGARYDTAVPDLCTASNAQLMLFGAPACPEGSLVGEGVVTVDSGVPGPARFVAADVDFLNNVDEQIFVNTVQGTPARTVLRANLDGGRNSVNAPFLPGTPPDGGAIDTVTVRDFRIVRELDGERHAYITTPPRCPDRGFWGNRASFTYYDGVTQTVTSHSPCED